MKTFLSSLTLLILTIVLLSCSKAIESTPKEPVEDSLHTIATFGMNTIGDTSVAAGTRSYSIWSAPITIAINGAFIQRLSFNIEGTSPNTLANFSLLIDGYNRWQVKNVTKDSEIVFSNAIPQPLSVGSHTILLIADIVAGTNTTFHIALKKENISLMDMKIGTQVIAKGCPNRSGAVTVKDIKLEIEQDPSLQVSYDRTGGMLDAPLARYVIKAFGEDQYIQALSVKPSIDNPDPSTQSIQNMSVSVNGSLVSSILSYDGIQPALFNFSHAIHCVTGERCVVEIRGDLRNDQQKPYMSGLLHLAVEIPVHGAVSAFSQIRNDTIMRFPTWLLAVYTQQLTLSKNPTYVNQNQPSNAKGVKIGSFILMNQSSFESIRLNELTIDLRGTIGLASLTNLRTSEMSGSGSIPIQPTASNIFSVDFTLAPGATRTIDILADIKDTPSGSTIISSLSQKALGVSSNMPISQGISCVGQTITIR